jgi:large subunit ribosomal protein L22
VANEQEDPIEKKPKAKKAPAKKAEAKPAAEKTVAAKTKKARPRKAKPVFEGPEVRAVAKWIRTAPRKLRLVADMVRGKKASEAVTLLDFTNKRAARTLNKVIKSAIANAENNHELDTNKLVVSQLYVDQGPMFKRYLPKSRGRATPVLKYGSHITVVVRQRQEGI